VEYDLDDDDSPVELQEGVYESESDSDDEVFTEDYGEDLGHSDLNLTPNLPTIFKDVSI
jgi:hypothetical protein